MIKKSLIKFKFNTEEISLVFAVNDIFIYLLLFSNNKRDIGWIFKLLDLTLIVEHKIRFNFCLLYIIKQRIFKVFEFVLEDLLIVSLFKVNSWVLFKENNKTNYFLKQLNNKL